MNKGTTANSPGNDFADYRREFASGGLSGSYDVSEDSEFRGIDKSIAQVLGYAQLVPGQADRAEQYERLKDGGAGRIFDDPAGGRGDRPGLAALFDYARPGDRLCVTRLNRLARSISDLLAIVAELKRRGMHLVCLEERIDTSVEGGNVVFDLFARISEFEAQRLAGAPHGNGAGHDRAARPGRPPVPDETAEALLGLVRGGLSPTQAATRLGIGRSTAYRIVRAAERPDE